MNDKKCKSCGKSFVIVDEEGNRVTKVDTQFCSTGCKNDFHNTARKAQRKLDSINKALEELQAITRQYGHNHEFWFIDRAREKIIDKIVTRDYSS